MTSRALRLALLVVFVGLLAGAGYAIWQAEHESRQAARAARAFDDRIRAASRALLDVRSAQPGYVAAGQGEDFWMLRVDSLLATTRETLTDLDGRVTSAAASASLQTARDALRDFEQMDRRARSYARSGQRLLASDLVFSDGIEKIDATLTALDHARDEERAAADGRVQESRRAELVALAGAGAGGLLLMFLLTPVPRVATRAAAPAAAALPPVDQPALALREAPAAAPEPVPAVMSAPPTPATQTVDLSDVAALCTELARVLDRQALPAALERAATMLDASGIVVWIADPDGRELVPVIAHGYPPAVVARLGRITPDMENVTAAAFRTGVMQTLHGDATSSGAIAAPLVGVDGPVGVMAAEVLHDGEQQEVTRATAAIIAAQLATLMGPPPVRAHGSTEAAGA